MQLKEWAFLGNYEFFTNKVRMLATQELAPEKYQKDVDSERKT